LIFAVLKQQLLQKRETEASFCLSNTKNQLSSWRYLATVYQVTNVPETQTHNF